MRAEELYVGVIVALVCVVGYGGGCDGYLYLTGQPNITQFLRENPRYYFYPLVGVLTFISLFTTHLYLVGS